jgi:hypothetical protein
MKLFTTFALVLSTLMMGQEAKAQHRGRRYNPPSHHSSGSSRSSGRSSSSRTTVSSRPSSVNRGPRYNPPASRPSTPAPRRTYTPAPTRTHTPAPRGPRYNPPAPTRTYTPAPSTPRGPRYNPPTPRPSTGGYFPNRTGPRYNPPSPRPGSYKPVPRGPRYNPPGRVIVRPSRDYYGTPRYHRPWGYNPIPYSRYHHIPYTGYYYHSTRYSSTTSWYIYVWSNFPDYIYVNWIFYPASGYTNGYWRINDYPYFVSNGYRYRYSHIDSCNYQLVDGWNHQVLESYWNLSCSTGYDLCSGERDRLNDASGDFRYFCAETFRDSDYDYSRPSYDGDDNWSTTCTDYDSDGFCDSGSF